MATSGSVDFNLDMAEITEEAFERCGLEFRTGYDSKTARRSLNLLFADWANRGLNLWTIEQITQTMAQLSTSITVTIPSGAFTAGENITGSSSAATTTISADPSLADVQCSGDILEAVIRRSDEDISITRISRQEYLSIPKKTTQGRPTQFYMDRQITPSILVWPAPENSTDSLIYYRVKRIQDADAAVNTADIPFRFLPCLIAGLSYQIALKRSPQRIEALKLIYEEEFQRASSEDIDHGIPLRLVPTYQSLRI